MAAMMGMSVTVFHYQMIDPLTGRAQHPLVTMEYPSFKEGSKMLYNKIKNVKVKVLKMKSKSGGQQMELEEVTTKELSIEEELILGNGGTYVEHDPSTHDAGISSYVNSRILEQYRDRYVCVKVDNPHRRVDMRRIGRAKATKKEEDLIEAAKRRREPVVLDDYHRIARGLADGYDVELAETSSSIDADDDEASSITLLGSYPIEFIRSKFKGSPTSSVAGEATDSDMSSLRTSTSQVSDDDYITHDAPLGDAFATQSADTFVYGTPSLLDTATSSEEHLVSATGIASPSSISDNDVDSSAMHPPFMVDGPEPPHNLTRRASTSSHQSNTSASNVRPASSAAVAASSAMASVKGTASRPSSIQSRLSSHSIVSVNQRLRLNGVTSVNNKYYLRSGADTPENASVHTNNSVIYLSLDDLVEQHPELTVELEALKKSITDHIHNVRQEKIGVNKSLEYQVEELCDSLSEKDDQIKHHVSLIEKAYRKVDAAEARLESIKKELKQSDVSRGIWEREYKLKAREVDMDRRTYNCKVINLEREKRALVGKLQYMEAKLDTERVRANGAEHAKENAMALVQGMRKHFDFYRNYYEAQAELHRQYDPSGPASTDSKDPGKGREADQAKADGKNSGASTSAIQQTTQGLREQYLRMLDSDGGERIRGFEFLAELERSSGGHNTHDAAVKTDDDEVEGTTLPSNFLPAQR